MPLTPPPKNVAVVHDWLVDFAGAEQVLEQILALFPDATLYTLIDKLPSADRQRLRCKRIVTSGMQRWPGIQRYFTRCLPFMPLAIQQFDLSGHDLIISSSHCVAKGVITPPDALHLSYCHSPMRYAWDLQNETLRTEGLDRGWKGWLARRLFFKLRLWDAQSHHGVDHFAANSNFVRQRILKCYRRDAVVIHPPVAIEGPAPVGETQQREAGHFVTVGRLMGYKNVALMLEAFRLRPHLRLTVAGDGPLRAALMRQAPPNVEFVGSITEAEKWRLLQRATAFVFAAVEDFGIAPVEALAAGTPVVALGRGGALDYVQHGVNGWFFNELRAQSLADTLPPSPPDMADDCRDSAAAFSTNQFKHHFSAWTAACWANFRADQQ